MGIGCELKRIFHLNEEHKLVTFRLPKGDSEKYKVRFFGLRQNLINTYS